MTEPDMSRQSWAPPLMALGLMLTLWGAAATWIVSAVGIGVIGVAAHRWIQDLRGNG
jgi:hypothetical protein